MLFRFALLSTAAVLTAEAQTIDRHALVSRHDPIVQSVNPDATLTVGNGEFAFGCDVTGLQTFADLYHREGVPTETLARWCWHTDPNPNAYTLAEANQPYQDAEGKTVSYPTAASSPAGIWLRENPRIQALGQIGFEWTKADGSHQEPGDVQSPYQRLDLWSGVVTSDFSLAGTPVAVETACHPDRDLVAVRITSSLLASGALKVRIAFPIGYDLAVKNTPALDWSHPQDHQTTVIRTDANGCVLSRIIGETRYYVAVYWDGAAHLEETAPHSFALAADSGDTLRFTVEFSSAEPVGKVSTAIEALDASKRHWEAFWRSGAAVDFAGSSNPLANELERRVVLSQYLAAVQLAADMPPQETGLTCSSWYGKHHTEMIWWHAAHFALWGRDALLATNLEWYRERLPAARELAASRNLKGARWAKMVGPEERESPGGTALIVWNQPQPIYLCELLYRNNPTAETLATYRDLVLETADCLASMAHRDPSTGIYSLGPPLWIAQEIYSPSTSRNPSFELAYWKWALGVAQKWRERLGMGRDAEWDRVIANLAPLPQKDGKYVALESHPDTWDNVASRHDHPEMLMPLGFLPPTEAVDAATMNRTLDAVLKDWDWETKIWGWDYPMIAMTAARLGRPEDAVAILLRDGPNNRYLPDGHCPQSIEGKGGKRTRPEIATYLPANGALLSAVALMVAGWDGCDRPFPGFPNDGTWKIRAEGLKRLP